MDKFRHDILLGEPDKLIPSHLSPSSLSISRGGFFGEVKQSVIHCQILFVFASMRIMPWSFISDVHIKTPGDAREQIIRTFLKKSDDLKVKKIFLLGDIFDLMVGEKIEYLKYYHNFFNALADSKAQEIHFFEGNHDFHLKSVWENFKKKYPSAPQIFYHREGIILEKLSKKIWFSHGDDIEIGNYQYKIYSFFIRSKFIQFFAKWVFPLCLINRIGKAISKMSKNHNKAYYGFLEQQESKKKGFRDSALKIARRREVEIVVAGHSHVKDLIHLDNCTYINNGYVPTTRCFGFIDEIGNVKHISLD